MADRSGVVVDCPRCSARVFGETIAQYEPPVDEDIDFHYKIVLLKCPSCQHPLVVETSLGHVGDSPEMDWLYAKRVWPHPEEEPNYYLPLKVRAALLEARRCYDAGAYTACAVMVRRLLESVCEAVGAQGRTLQEQLADLLARGKIDARLYEWAEELRKHGNLGAHATGQDIRSTQARDLLDFAEAICEYVFVLTKKFERFRARTNGSLTAVS